MQNSEGLLMSYRPRYAAHAPESWAAVAEFVRASVRAYASGREYEQVRVALIAVAYFAYWLLFVGIDALDRSALRADLIEAYARSRAPSDVAPITPAKQRKVLLAVASLETTREEGRTARTVSTPLAPFNAGELAAIRDWAQWQPNEISRLSAHGLVGLGLGCGLTRAEFPAVHRKHVVHTVTSHYVQVTGRRARQAPVDPVWADILDYAVTHATDFLIAPQATHRVPSNFDQWFATSRGEAPLPSRMRNTWLLARMDDGMSADELVSAAGLSTIRSLERFIRVHAPQHQALQHGARSKK